MRRILLLAVLALALPTAMFATSSIDYSNSGGTLTGSATGGLTLSGSDVSQIRAFPSGTIICPSNCGTVSFTTGALLSGSLAMGGTFANGGSFTIMGSGGGVLFTGTFSGPNPVTWTLTTDASGNHSYTLEGTLSGTTASGFRTTGITVQLTQQLSTGQGYFEGTVGVASGNTNIVVPEPGSLGLLGTGLIGLAGLVRRKLKA